MLKVGTAHVLQYIPYGTKVCCYREHLEERIENLMGTLGGTQWKHSLGFFKV